MTLKGVISTCMAEEFLKDIHPLFDWKGYHYFSIKLLKKKLASLRSAVNNTFSRITRPFKNSESVLVF